MKDRQIDRFLERLAKARADDPKADLTSMVEPELKKAKNHNEKLYLLNTLAQEYAFVGRNKDAEKIHQEILTIDPDTPVSWMNFAYYLYFYAHELDRALQAADKAVEKSLALGDLLRETHGARMRIALALKRYDLVEESLRRLLDYVPAPESLDAELGLEKKVIGLIPPGAVDDRVLKSYQQKAGLL